MSGNEHVYKSGAFPGHFGNKLSLAVVFISEMSSDAKNIQLVREQCTKRITCLLLSGGVYDGKQEQYEAERIR